MAVSQQIFEQYINNVWIIFGLKIVAVVGLFLTAPMVVGYVEHKTLAHMQARLGPMEAGKFHGWAQLIADGVKFIQKEDITPTAADKFVFTIAPGIVMVPAILVFFVVPFGPNGWWAENLDVGVFFALAISSISVIGMLAAGWSSANKFSLIGAVRGAAQLIAYELPLLLATAAVVMQAGTLSLPGIAAAQSHYWYVLPQFAGFMLFIIASLAELSRPPFDMPIADSEIIFGHMTEYTGVKFAFFLLTEYAGIVSLSAIASVLFLGGWQPLPLIKFVPGPLWILGKTGILSFIVIWLRATYPRLREDQLQKMAWKYMIPIALLDILLTGIFKVVF
ncbi:MAG: NADH-quinone oxidoreductase subunit NuoH [Actinomycetota bacterium]|nr:NADH-quinone oxidoreductase subunit NuoH [Actinomycetota bacterium]